MILQSIIAVITQIHFIVLALIVWQHKQAGQSQQQTATLLLKAIRGYLENHAWVLQSFIHYTHVKEIIVAIRNKLNGLC